MAEQETTLGPDKQHDIAVPELSPLVPLGSGNKPLVSLDPIYTIAKSLRDPNAKPKNEAFACERVAMFAREQFTVTEPFVKIEAKKINDNTFRVNWLAVDTGPANAKPGFSRGGKTTTLLTTYKRVASKMVRVVWGTKIILTEVPNPVRDDVVVATS